MWWSGSSCTTCVGLVCYPPNQPKVSNSQYLCCSKLYKPSIRLPTSWDAQILAIIPAYPLHTSGGNSPMRSLARVESTICWQSSSVTCAWLRCIYLAITIDWSFIIFKPRVTGTYWLASSVQNGIVSYSLLLVISILVGSTAACWIYVLWWTTVPSWRLLVMFPVVRTFCPWVKFINFM